MEDRELTFSMRVPRIKGRFDVGDPGIKIEVIDTGCGIDPGDFHNVFTPFYTTKKRLGPWPFNMLETGKKKSRYFKSKEQTRIWKHFYYDLSVGMQQQRGTKKWNTRAQF